MLIAKIENGQVIDIADYRAMFHNVVIPKGDAFEPWLAEKGCKKVNVFRSYDQLTQKLIPCTPVIEGDWVYTVEVAELSQDEINNNKQSAMAQLRSLRNALLSATDWRFRSDMTPSQEWKDYCQALRDFPATIEDARLPYVFPHDPNYVPLVSE